MDDQQTAKRLQAQDSFGTLLVGFALWIGGYRISISVRLRVLDT